VSTPLRKTIDLGTDFWNDSCAIHELNEAVAAGATGATSNPVIVSSLLKGDPKTWNPLIERLAREFPRETEDEIAWRLIHDAGIQAAKILEPIHKASGGKKGHLSMQVNAKYYRDAERMYRQGKELAALAPNIAIKAPATAAGIEAMKRLTADGVIVNATVSFTVAQAVAVAEALEKSIQPGRALPYVTIMVGRTDDHIGRIMASEKITVDPSVVPWAGVAVFKRAHAEFKKRGYRSQLLAAAYRHQLHWTELVGSGVLMTMPYAWWKQFNASDVTPSRRIDEPVPEPILRALQSKFKDFNRAYEPDGMKPEEFASFGATVHTLNQFLGGYADLVAYVRDRMVR